MVTEVRKTDVSARALKETRLARAARDSEAKRIRESVAAREIEIKTAVQSERPERPERPEVKLDYGKYNDYTVNSDHEVVVTVRERATGKKIKQIPSEAELATRHAYRRALEDIVDETV